MSALSALEKSGALYFKIKYEDLKTVLCVKNHGYTGLELGCDPMLPFFHLTS